MSLTIVTRSHFRLQQHVQRLVAQRHISQCLTTIATRSTIGRRRNLSSAVSRVAVTHMGDDTLYNKKSITDIILLSVAAAVATIIGAGSLNTDNNSNNKSSYHQQWKHSNNNDTKTSLSSRFQESSPRYRYLYGFPIFPPLMEITNLYTIHRFGRFHSLFFLIHQRQRQLQERLPNLHIKERLPSNTHKDIR
jgi:hypothetical protein